MPRILANLTADSHRRVFTDSDIARLNALGDVTYFDHKAELDEEKYALLLAQADVLLTCWGSRSLSSSAWEKTGRADSGPPILVAHSAGSVRGVVPKELLQQNVRLTQGADAMVIAVAQYAVGLLIMALRQAVYRMDWERAGNKGKGEAGLPYRDLSSLTVGIVGLSRIGVLMTQLLKPFDCTLVAYDPYCAPEKAASLGVRLVADLDDLLRESDAVTIHLPVTPETENLLNAERVGLLKNGCAVVNTARTQVVDQDALFTRAMAGEIEYYADVTSPEPLPPSHEAWQSPHIFITPHIAGPTEQTLRRMATYAIDEIERYVSGQPLKYEVSTDRYDLLA